MSDPNQESLRPEETPNIPTNSPSTERTRARFGEKPEFNNQGGDSVADSNVNDTKTKNNPTMLDQIRGDNLSNNPSTGFGRTMVA